MNKTSFLRLQRSQLISLAAGFVLLIVAIIEVFEESEEAGIEVEHGLVLFAVAHIIRVSAELYERTHETLARVKHQGAE